jgi:hypothetical protein
MRPFQGGPPLRGQYLPVFGLVCDPRRPPCWRTTILAHLGHSTRWLAAVFWAGSSVAGFDFLTVFGFAALGLRPFRTHTAHSEAPTGAIPMRQCEQRPVLPIERLFSSSSVAEGIIEGHGGLAVLVSLVGTRAWRTLRAAFSA